MRKTLWMRVVSRTQRTVSRTKRTRLRLREEVTTMVMREAVEGEEAEEAMELGSVAVETMDLQGMLAEEKVAAVMAARTVAEEALEAALVE